MYSLKAILDKEPAAIAEGIRAIILALAAFGILNIGEQNLAVAMLAISALLTLFVRNASTPKAAPTLAEGTEVKVAGSQDSVVIAPTPPGPVGIEGGGVG